MRIIRQNTRNTGGQKEEEIDRGECITYNVPAKLLAIPEMYCRTPYVVGTRYAWMWNERWLDYPIIIHKYLSLSHFTFHQTQ